MTLKLTFVLDQLNAGKINYILCKKSPRGLKIVPSKNLKLNRRGGGESIFLIFNYLKRSYKKGCRA